MSEQPGDNRLPVLRVVIKVLVEPFMGVKRSGNQVACCHRENEHRAKVPYHDGKTGKREDFAEVLRAGQPFEATAERNLVSRLVWTRIRRPQITQNAVRVNVQREAEKVNGKADLESGVTEPFGRVLSAEFREVGCVEVAMQNQRNPAGNHNPQGEAGG